MGARRVLLIEALDAAGASPSDAILRTDLLEQAGFEASALAVALRPGAAVGEPEGEAAVSGAAPIARDRVEVGSALERARPDLAIVASSAPGGGAVAAWLPRGLPALWWPTGLHSSLAAGGFPAWKSPALLRPLAPGRPAGSPPFAGLEWSVLEARTAGGRRLTPWDGEYVLAPVPLEGRVGREALLAFASVAHTRDSLDLVLLESPRPELMRLARRAGVGTRVHFAGAAPRAAEYAWVHAAGATLLACSGSLSGGVVLRALACASPILALGNRGVGRKLRMWLEQSGCTLTTPGIDPHDLAHVLARLLERGPQVEHAIARGRAHAALHHPPAMATKLTAALSVEPQPKRAAA